MKTILKAAVVLALVVFVAIQFINRPDRTNPSEDPSMTITSRLAVPEDVRAMLDRSCADCHSNRTRWPWYSAVAPVSWLVAADVEEGREHLNFSAWGSYSRKRQASRMEMIATVVDKDEMPMKSYLLLHPDAELSEADKDLLCSWAEDQSDSLMNSAE